MSEKPISNRTTSLLLSVPESVRGGPPAASRPRTRTVSSFGSAAQRHDPRGREPEALLDVFDPGVERVLLLEARWAPVGLVEVAEDLRLIATASRWAKIASRPFRSRPSERRRWLENATADRFVPESGGWCRPRPRGSCRPHLVSGSVSAHRCRGVGGAVPPRRDHRYASKAKTAIPISPPPTARNGWWPPRSPPTNRAIPVMPVARAMNAQAVRQFSRSHPRMITP